MEKESCWASAETGRTKWSELERGEDGVDHDE